jgi:deoxyribodipyrimidine photo-lyase
MRTAIMLFTRDLRVHDNPALRAANDAADQIVPLFVFDDVLLDGFAAPNRLKFLLEALDDLDDSLTRRGAPLVRRRGHSVREVKRIAEQTGADSVFVADDVSAFAQRRIQALRDARLDVHACPGVTVVPPAALAPTGGDWFKVFTPYWRRWKREPKRTVLAPPRSLKSPQGLKGTEGQSLRPRRTSPGLPAGGETAARRRARAWMGRHLADYETGSDDLAGDRTSRLSPYIHFGCISPGELVAMAGDHGEAFVRQLCWRDFHHQLLHAEPRIADEDQHPGRRDWNDDPDGLAAWKEAQTGVPLVDAGMTQLRAEGWMHNRARLVVGSYLTKTLGIDWREGARHFYEWLVDGDIANNAGNWQWVAGTGADTRPNRRLNPERQAKRFDPESAYIERWLGDVPDRLF